MIQDPIVLPPEDEEYLGKVVTLMVEKNKMKDWYDYERMPVMVTLVISDYMLAHCKNYQEQLSFVQDELFEVLDDFKDAVSTLGTYNMPNIVGPIKRISSAFNIYLIIAFPRKD